MVGIDAATQRHTYRSDRTAAGRISVGRSLSADRRSKARTIVKKGEGDRGDRS